MADKTYSFEVNRSSKADPETLFGMVADGGRWPEWAKPLVLSAVMVAKGDDEPLGVGAVRKVGAGPLGLKERTTAHEPGRKHAYELLTPGPVRNYRAEVTFTPRADGGTDLRWTGTFDEKVPGTGKVLAAGLQRFIGALAGRLVAAADR